MHHYSARPFVVRITRDIVPGCLGEVRAWLDEQGWQVGEWTYVHQRNEASSKAHYSFHFDDEDKALLFKLTWGGSL